MYIPLQYVPWVEQVCVQYRCLIAVLKVLFRSQLINFQKYLFYEISIHIFFLYIMKESVLSLEEILRNIDFPTYRLPESTKASL